MPLPLKKTLSLKPSSHTPHWNRCHMHNCVWFYQCVCHVFQFALISVRSLIRANATDGWHEYPALMRCPIVQIVNMDMQRISKRTSDVKTGPISASIPLLLILAMHSEHSSPIMVHAGCEAAQPACSQSRPCHKCSRQLPAPNLLPGVSERWSG